MSREPSVPVDETPEPTGRPGDRLGREQKPLLMVDIDGVISLFGFPTHARPEGSFHSIDGIPHLISPTAAEHLLELACAFELVWASGWEDKANDYLPHLLGLPGPLPFLSFERGVGLRRSTDAHWKLAAIDAYAAEQPLAWIDDALDRACHEWSAARAAPTLLVHTAPDRGLTQEEAEQLMKWAQALA